MAIVDRDTGETTYEGRVYSSRGSFKCDMHTDIVEVIEDSGAIRIIELNDLARQYATVDATEESISLKNAYAETRSRVYKISRLRRCIEKASKTVLSTREYIDLCIGLKDNPNWKRTERYRGLGAELFFSNQPSIRFDNEGQVSSLLERFAGNENLGKLSKFEKSLVQQCIDWAKTDPAQRKYDQPLSKKQLSYLDKDWARAA
jgi:hypothetical protein